MSQMFDIVRSFTAGGPIAAKRLVKFSADNTVVQAAGPTDAIIGVADLGAVAAGDRVDVVMQGLPEVEFGGTVTVGALVTSDANGKAVAAAPAAGVNNRVAGAAVVSAVSGDISTVFLSLGSLQG